MMSPSDGYSPKLLFVEEQDATCRIPGNDCGRRRLSCGRSGPAPENSTDRHATLANNGEAILNQVRTVTDRPVSMIINTHSHPDHVGSNDYFPASVEKVTQENTKKWMAAQSARGVQSRRDRV